MSTLVEALRDALQELFLPVIAATRYDSAWRGLLNSLGHTDQVASDHGLHNALDQTATTIESISGIDPGTLLSWDGLQHVIQIGSDADSAIRALQQAASDATLSERIAGLGEELIEELVAQYLRNNHRVLFRVSSALTIITPAEFSPVEQTQFDGSTITRLPWQRSRFRFERIQDLMSDPWRALLESYFPNHLAGAADAHRSAALLFPQLGALADSLRLWWRSDIVPVLPAPLPEPLSGNDLGLELDHFAGADDHEPDVDIPVQPPPDLTAYYTNTLPRFLFAVPRADGDADPHFAIALLLSSAQHPNGIAGLIITPIGNFNSAELRGSWQISITSNGQIPAFVAGPGGFSLAPSSNLTGGSVRVLLERLPDPDTSGPAFVFGSAQGTRLELGNLRLDVNVSSYAEQAAASIGLFATSGALVLAPGDADGFLSAALPDDGLRCEFDLGVELSSAHGLRFKGAAGLDAAIPVGLSLGAVTVPMIHISLHPSDSGLAAEVSASLAVAMGPVRALVDRVGITTAVKFPKEGGNLGVGDLVLNFKSPSGVGVAIDATGVTGGGFLSFHETKGEYSGVVMLNLEGGITVKGFGLITTRLPNGATGFSFLVMLTAEGFEPIPLGLGFTLTGIGGLLAINRTCNTDFLREGLKNDTLKNVLFPQDPVHNAVQILGTLDKAFPPQNGSYLFAPVVQICWGTPPVLTMDLALILELGSRTRLIILGRIKSILPSEQDDLIRLQMDALGVIDFDQKTIALDAVLYDSRLVHRFPLTGSMALRAKWSASGYFALSIGGFHPAFHPPSGFPTLQRLTLSLADTPDLRLRCDGYYALTFNTLQFGAHAELMARAAGFSIEGHIGYDVLIQFDPFEFVADFEASVQLKYGSTNLFQVNVQGELAGPLPLHIKGKATFSILLCDCSVHFDQTLVSGIAPPALVPVNVLPMLSTALNDPRNWGGQLADGDRRLVTLRDPQSTDQIALHPLGRLSVTQKVVPLELPIARFGNAWPADATLFKINSLSVNGKSVPFARVDDFFVPSQFLEMSDDEKLAAPSFEPMTAGISATTGGFAFTANDADVLQDEGITFETIIVDREHDASQASVPYTLTAALLNQQIPFGAAANSPVRQSGTARYRPAKGKDQLVKTGWTIAAAADGSPQGAPGVAAGRVVSFAAAFQARQSVKQQNPQAARGLMVVPAGSAK